MHDMTLRYLFLVHQNIPRIVPVDLLASPDGGGVDDGRLVYNACRAVLSRDDDCCPERDDD